MEHLAIQVENFGDVIGEMKPLFQRHWEELALDKETVPLDPDWARYAAMEAQGQLSTVTVRCRGELVGYAIMIVTPGLHYRSTLHGVMDMFWLAPEHRGHFGGIRLFKRVEAELKRRGVRRIFVGSKLHRDTSRLFTALGYWPIEHWFSKMV